jgi:hypothetical protein
MAAFDSFEASNTLKEIIVRGMIEPNYKNEVKENLSIRKHFKRMGLYFDVTSKIFIGIASVVSFSSGIYKYPILPFLAGTASTMSLVFIQFSSFAYREAKKSSSELNIILKKLNIQEMPDSIIGPSSMAPETAPKAKR